MQAMVDNLQVQNRKLSDAAPSIKSHNVVVKSNLGEFGQMPSQSKSRQRIMSQEENNLLKDTFTSQTTQ